MKKFIIPMIIAATIVALALTSVTVFNTKTFPKSSTRTDTSTGIDLKGSEMVELATSVYGTDSIKITSYIDGWVSGQWVKVYQDSLVLDNSSVTPGRGQILRGYNVNNIKGIERIRVRNLLQNAGDDSTSANYYNQYIILR